MKKPQPISKQIYEVITEERITLQGEKENQINILLLGIGGDGHSGGQLTDTIMVASINPSSQKVTLISIPRDLYVKYPCLESYGKINSVYIRCQNNDRDNPQAGINAIKIKSEEITSLPIHYFVKLDFKGFEEIVDSLGGIDITLNENIDDPLYPGPNFSYEHFSIEAGNHHLDGPTALKVARSRHFDPEGDFGRAKRQQLILNAIHHKTLEKIKHFNLIALGEIIKSLEENLNTNLTLAELKSFYQLSQEIETEKTKNLVLSNREPDPLLKSRQVRYSLIPQTGLEDYSQIKKSIQNLIHE
jgi:LCP family protein required for cell wall assembly